MLNYCYTLKDLLKVLNNTYPLMQTISEPAATYKDSEMLFTLLKAGFNRDEFSKILALNELSASDLYGDVSTPSHIAFSPNITPYTKLISLIKIRYQREYIVLSPEEIHLAVQEVGQSTNEWRLTESNEEFESFCEKFIGILISTKDKYLSILNIYEDNLSKLMNGLKNQTDSAHTTHRDEDYDTDVNGMNLYNDTPQTTDVVATMEGDQYVTELSKSAVHTDNTGDVDETGEKHDVIVSDTKYAMEKIKDIQDSFEKVLYRWSEEFHGLFIEEEMVL